jgi:hypothetical protein
MRYLGIEVDEALELSEQRGEAVLARIVPAI